MTVGEAYVSLKPKLRGWLHLGAVPAAVICGIVLIVLAPDHLRAAVVVYALSTVILFSVSATYHRGNWGPRATAVLRRLDHASIFILIAGSYTPFVAVLVTGESGTVLLWIVWTAAVLGVLFRVLWLGAPRWLVVPVYIALGCTALLWSPTIWHNGGVAVFALLVGGGICYVVGAVIYGLRRPDPSPKWFGFHEVFHSFTLGGFISHYVGISIAVYGATAIATS